MSEVEAQSGGPRGTAARYATTRMEFTGPSISGGVMRMVKASMAMSCVAEAIVKMVIRTQNHAAIVSRSVAKAARISSITATAPMIQRR